MRRKRKPKLNKKAIIISAVIAFILIPIIAYGSYLAYILYFSSTPTIVNPPQEEDGDEPIMSNLPTPEESGIENIVLFGVDDRTPTDKGRTDSIIIATIDKNAKVIKLTSIMRDLYVKQRDTNHMDRINASYVYGGPEGALKTINNNFGLNIKYYAIIDFLGFQDLVDAVGGVDIDVKSYEVQEINKYIKEVNESKSTLLKGPGFQTLNGQQALSYARIRKVGNGDWERTERQRTVLKAIMEKVKTINVLKIPQLITTLASFVETNIPLSKIASLGMTVYGFDGGMQTMRIPVDGYYSAQKVYGNSVLVPDIKANAQFLQEFIYNMKFVGNKDLPSYMQNNFHLDDSLASERPKPNIPDYSTPDPIKEGEEEITTPTTTPENEIPDNGSGVEIPPEEGGESEENPGDNPSDNPNGGENDGPEGNPDDGPDHGEDEPGEGTEPATP